MSLEKDLIKSIKRYCLSESYLDGFDLQFGDGLSVAKSIILEKIEKYEYENDEFEIEQ